MSLNSVHSFSKRFLLTLFFAFGPLQLHADETLPRGLKSLLDQSDRPTVSQLEALIKKNPEVKTFLRDQTLVDHFRKEFAERVAPTLALSEKLYPNATFFVMGRDAVIMGDALDAVLSRLGEPNRVRRVDLSGPSFGSDPRLLQQYFNQIGLNPVRLLKEKQNAIILDRSSYQLNSQSFQIIEDLYRYAERYNKRNKALFKRLIFFGLNRSFNGDQIPTGKALEAKMASIESSIDRAKRAHYVGAPDTTLQIPGMTDSTPWHDSWGVLKKDSNKDLPVQPVRGRGHPENHLLVLRELNAILEVSEDPNFWAELVVQKQRHQLKLGQELALAKGGKELKTLLFESLKETSRSLMRSPEEHLKNFEQLISRWPRGVYNWSHSEGKLVLRQMGTDLPTFAKTDPEFSRFYYEKYLPEAVRILVGYMKKGFMDVDNGQNFAYYVQSILGPVIPRDYSLALPTLNVLQEEAKTCKTLHTLLTSTTMDHVFEGCHKNQTFNALPKPFLPVIKKFRGR